MSKLEKENVSKETKQEVQKNIHNIATGKGKKLFGGSKLSSVKEEASRSDIADEEKEVENLMNENNQGSTEKLQPVDVTKHQKETFNDILKGENINDYTDKPVSKSGIVIISPGGHVKNSYRSFSEFKESEQYKEYRKEMLGYKATKKYGVPIVFKNADALFTLPSKIYNSNYPTNTMRKRNKKKYKKEKEGRTDGSVEKEEKEEKDAEK